MMFYSRNVFARMAGTAPARCRRTPQVRSNAFLGSHFYASETMIVLPRQARDKHIIVKVPGIKLELAFCLQASGTFRWGSAWSSRAGNRKRIFRDAFSGKRIFRPTFRYPKNDASFDQDRLGTNTSTKDNANRRSKMRCFFFFLQRRQRRHCENVHEPGQGGLGEGERSDSVILTVWSDRLILIVSF